MSLNPTMPNEPIQVDSIKLYIYADPSMGKSSLAMTAKNAIVLDADLGAYRTGALRRSPVQSVDRWNILSNLTAEDFEAYDTVVIDTVGRLLDVVKAHFAENKNNLMGNGAIKQQTYTPINNAFIRFINMLIFAGKDVIFLAHATEDKNKDDDSIIHRPDLGGKNRNELYRLSDCMAYFTNESTNNGGINRVLNFSQGATYHSKDCANLGKIKVPDLTHNPTFLGDLIQSIKNHLNTLTPEQKLYVEQEQHWIYWQQCCSEAQYANDFNTLTGELLSDHAENPRLKNMWDCVKHYAKNAGFKYNKETSKWFENKENAA
ncbi:ATP-binding protein [Acinetobacter ursingii]|uniref:ATP-binding protein n=1 Tax=Acinetobacter ursingii TaxID=108980 RepID=UPI00124FB52C|nr:ATP-binding protein [Acinetobacter ursingii]